MFKKNFINVLSISFLIYPISFFNQLLTSYFFGTDEILDLYWISMSTSILITIHIAPIKEVITKEYFSIRKYNILEANKFLSENILCSLFLSLLIGLILWLFPIYFLKIISGATIKNHDQAILMLKLLIVYMVLMSFSEIIGSVLVSLGKVVHQNIGKLIIATFSVIFLLILADIFKEIVLVLGLLVGMIVYLVFQLLELKKLSINLTLFCIPKLDKRILSKFGFLFLATIFGYLLSLYERNVFSEIANGFISSFQYARSLNDVAQNLFVLALATSLWPDYLESIHQKNVDKVFEISRKKLFFIAITFTFITINFYLLAEHIIYLIYYRGSFDIESLNMTVKSFRGIVLAMLPISMNTIFTRALFSFNAINTISISLILSTFLGFLFLYLGKEHNDIILVSHYLVAFNYFNFIILGFYFLKLVNRNNLKFYKYIMLLILKITLIAILFLNYYDFINFEIEPKSIVFIDFIMHSFLISIIFFTFLFFLGIIKKNHIKRISFEINHIKRKIFEKNYN